MAVVSKITQQKKNQEYYNLFIDGNFAFSIHGELVVLHGIKKGKHIDVQEMEEIIYENSKKRAFNACLYYLSYRRRTQWEIEEYLKKKEYTEEIIKEPIEKLKYYNMIDDEAYVKAFISEKKLGNPTGRKKLQYDLAKKGISEELLNNMSQWFSEEDEYEQAQKLATKYNKKYAKLSKREKVYKIGQAGQRRGFSWEIMKRAVQDIVQETETETEEENQYPQEVDMNKAMEWGEKYKGRYEKKGLKDFHLKQKISQALMRRGYKWDIIEEVLKEVLSKDNKLL